MVRFKSVDKIPLVPAEEFFKEYPNVTSYFSTQGPIGTDTKFEICCVR